MTTTIRVNKKLHFRLKVLAAELGRKLKDLVNDFLEHGLKKESSKKAKK